MQRRQEPPGLQGAVKGGLAAWEDVGWCWRPVAEEEGRGILPEHSQRHDTCIGMDSGERVLMFQESQVDQFCGLECQRQAVVEIRLAAPGI